VGDCRFRAGQSFPAGGWTLRNDDSPAYTQLSEPTADPRRVPPGTDLGVDREGPIERGDCVIGGALGRLQAAEVLKRRRRRERAWPCREERRCGLQVAGRAPP